MKNTAIGIDIGGGSVKLGIVDSKGKVLARSYFATPIKGGREKLLALLSAHILDLKKEAKNRGCAVQGVGIGAPGPIDVEKGFVYFFPNIPGWKNTPLKALLEKHLGLSVYVDNDANVMALAEYLYGAGRGSKNIIALTLGTGVGGGIVLNGELFHGHAFSAAEIGHMIIDENGPLCACGNHGCIETFVGTRYFVNEVNRRLKSGEKSLLRAWLKKGQTLTPYLVAQAAYKGDAFSKKMWQYTGEKLGTALVGLINLLNPEKIILGGGIAQNGKIVFDPAIRAIRKKAFPIAAGSVKVVPAKLGIDAGLVGAASLVFAAKGNQ